MNNEYENKAYPCDEGEEKRSYPCDTPEAFFDGSAAGVSGEETETAPVKKGKGRRGGNAAASIVVHSGKFRSRPERETEEGKKERPERHDRSERRERRGGSERNDRYERSDRSERYGRSDKKHGGRPGSGPDRDRRPDAPESVYNRAYTVRVLSTSEIGAFVEAPRQILSGKADRRGEEQTKVLLPFAEQLGRPEPGKEIRVHFYEDKGGRLTATMRTPILKDGEVGILEVAAVTRIGAFLDNGIPKQVLLPFREQISSPEVGDEVLVWLYTDKSGRQAATMRVYSHLDRHSPYKEDDRVTGFVYEVNPEMGVFVAVDNKYYGMVPIRETFKEYAYGDEVEARVARVREDGKLDLLIREKLYKTVQEDADVILYELRRNNGFLPYGDRADAAFIEETYAMSKNQFKRALGHLYKNHVVELDREHDTVRLL